MAVLLNIITSTVWSLQMPENWGQKLIISSDFECVSNILTLPSIICVHKRSGDCKISTRYFSKMLLLILRYQTYRPTPNLDTLFQLGFILVHWNPNTLFSFSNGSFAVCFRARACPPHSTQTHYSTRSCQFRPQRSPDPRVGQPATGWTAGHSGDNRGECGVWGSACRRTQTLPRTSN